MRPDGMKRVFRMDQLESDIIPSSAHMRHWMINMDYLDNLGVFILDNKKGVEFPAPAHHEEELIWVLEGQLSYNHGPVINPGEAILIVPCLPHPGRFIGKLLVFWCIPFTDSGLSSDAMNKTILPDRVDMNRIIRNRACQVLS